MIRTNGVTLTTIPGAVAYRRKMPSGGSCVVIIRTTEPQPGMATISKTSGGAIVSRNTPRDAYPDEAFEEAIELTAGMPYHRQSGPALPLTEVADGADDAGEGDAVTDGGDAQSAEEVIVDSEGYEMIVDMYTDKGGKLSYDLLNKDLIQLAHRSEHVAKMVAAGASEEEIRLHVVGTRFRGLTGNRNLTDEEVAILAGLIDEVSPRGAFKELNAEIRRMLGKAKRKA